MHQEVLEGENTEVHGLFSLKVNDATASWDLVGTNRWNVLSGVGWFVVH